MQDNSFESLENYPGEKMERHIAKEQDFERAFQEGVPEFSSERMFGVANEENNYYGETNDEEESVDEPQEDSESGGEGGDEETESRNQDIADAASLLNYGKINALTRELSVEEVINGIKNVDISGSDDPIHDLYNYLGVDTDEEVKGVDEESMASKTSEIEYQGGVNHPATMNKSKMGAVKAFKEMKELISLVESEDPRYEALRSGAKSAGMGVFEFAVKNLAVRGLTDLFHVLAKQREQKIQEEKTEEEVEDLVDEKVKEVLNDPEVREKMTEERLRQEQLGNNLVGQVDTKNELGEGIDNRMKIDKAKEDEIMNFIQNRINDDVMDDENVGEIVKKALENDERIDLLSNNSESENTSEDEN